MWPFRRPKVNIYVPPPPSPEAPAALAALRRVPGPSPWYLEGTALPSSGGLLQWQSAGAAAPLAGKSVLVNAAGAALALADFHCYACAAPGHRLLVWYVDERADGTDVRLRLFDLDALQPLGDVAAATTRLAPGERFLAAAGEVDRVALSTALADGSHQITLPPALRGVGELLLLAPSTAEGRRQNHFDQMHLRLWVLDAVGGTLDIVPQDWFNGGPYDFGYQWVTRVARLPGSGDVVGEGIRLGIFRLDATRRRIAAWLVTDTFYHPERESARFSAPEA